MQGAWFPPLAREPDPDARTESSYAIVTVPCASRKTEDGWPGAAKQITKINVIEKKRERGS